MDTVGAMRTFVRVAQRRGFASAARELRLSPASVTKQIAALETRVGARLLQRTTRHVALTEAGRVYLERCLECLQAFEDADASISELAAAPRGQLRVSAPIDLHAILPPIVAAFSRTHPQVRVDLWLSNRAVDLVDEGFDLAIRASQTVEGDYVARALATLRFGVYASPGYLREHGRPRKPSDLERHRAMVFVEPRPWESLVFERHGKEKRAVLTPAITSNSGDVLREAAIAGAGILASPALLVRTAVEDGRLERILRDWEVALRPKLWAVYPQRRFLPAKVRLFVEALKTELGSDPERDPWWVDDA